ncbi:hypothetical protein VNO80_04704 [Phaseolus coccineus]|uniref:EF-hand domain-containing protein n=1 Tax=Phaseolus coccineus TaxID=3886 RepID=A0AAN9RNX5_PHACN
METSTDMTLSFQHPLHCIFSPLLQGMVPSFSNEHVNEMVIQTSNSIMADDDPQDVADRERIFKHFDSNGDGQISSQELGEALKALGSVTPDEVQRMMDEIDTDGDGFISHEEFTDFARANRGLVRDVAKIF